MKKLKKMLGGLMALVVCLIPLLNTTIPAQAAGEVTTYYVKYVNDGTISDWRFQYGGWTDGGYHRELYYLTQNIKDGDKIVVEGTGDKTLYIEANANLSEVTFFSCATPVVTAKSIDTVYGLFGSKFAVNGDVKNAYVYENSVCNFNNNVSYLEIINSDADNIEATVYVGGTVAHAKSVGATKTHFDLYSFVAGSFTMHDGALYTKQEQCSQTPPAVATLAPAVPSTPSTSTGGEYDDVPKTADARFNPLWLIGMAVVCFAGGLALRKSK
ncbi:MAG: hypothetical protein IJX63_12340 [Lachnospiraceae bacterium]|nr:hypothetical protein [Lachnospiraceae bacterium]